MNGTTANNPRDSIQVMLGSSEYTVVAGTSVEIAALVVNTGAAGDFFLVKLLGFPLNWINPASLPPVWIPAGGQEKVTFKVSPDVAEDGAIGSHPGRLQIARQNAPGEPIELGVMLTVLPGDKTEGFTLSVTPNEVRVTPGSKVKISLTVRNAAQEAESLELSVQGVPPNWVSLLSPIIFLLGGEEKTFDLFFEVPVTAEIRAGYYPVKITAVSQKNPAVKGEIEVMLGIAAFDSLERIEVNLAVGQYVINPGSSLTIPFTVLNRGLDPDSFRLGTGGISPRWVSTSTPVIQLKPGESKEAALVIRPPLSSSSRAGRIKFQITVTSQRYIDQVAKAECVLTVAAFTRFSAGVEPREAETGQPVKVIVRNEGNTQEVFQLACESQNDQLVFQFLEPEQVRQPEEPGDPRILALRPGETAAFRFSARPRQRPLAGGPVAYPYHALVGPRGKGPQTLPGRLNSRAMIPIWVAPVALAVCLILAFFSGFMILGSLSQASSSQRTAAVGTSISAGATQTVIAGTALSANATQAALTATAVSALATQTAFAGATQTVSANQTAAVIAGQQDNDGDGLTNQREAEMNTDPSKPDTDSDGLMDGEEVFQAGTNPLNPDSDWDKLKDGDEIHLRTNPLVADTDGDKSIDGDEIGRGTNPLKPDTDGDAMIDGNEFLPCPDPLNPDTDQDGIVDGKDLSPCDRNNPALTATAAALRPTATPVPTQTSIAAPTPTLPPVALPPFKGSILFESDRNGNSEIYSEDSTGNVRRLTNNPGADTQPAWAPNKSRIAFTSNRDGQNEIYIMNADGSSLVNVTNNPADDQSPTWSPDGRWIAFSSNREGNSEIYVLQLDNLEIRNLSNHPASDTQPNWVRSKSMDVGGEFIVFTSDRDGNSEIYRMRTDGSDPLNLTVSPARDQMAKGSYDGGFVTFTTNRDGNDEIYLMDINGIGAANVTNNPARDYGAAWSPDLSWIAFTTDRTGNLEVFIISRYGAPTLYNVTNYPGFDQAADWR